MTYASEASVSLMTLRRFQTIEIINPNTGE